VCPYHASSEEGLLHIPLILLTVFLAVLGVADRLPPSHYPCPVRKEIRQDG